MKLLCRTDSAACHHIVQDWLQSLYMCLFCWTFIHDTRLRCAVFVYVYPCECASVFVVQRSGNSFQAAVAAVLVSCTVTSSAQSDVLPRPPGRIPTCPHFLSASSLSYFFPCLSSCLFSFLLHFLSTFLPYCITSGFIIYTCYIIPMVFFSLT